MSALAKLCLNLGFSVSGSDKTLNSATFELKHLGAIIYNNHNKHNVLGADLVVYTCAVNKSNVELIEAQNLGIKTFERAEFLGLISSLYKHVIAVSGTHGKTTTTGMLASIFDCAGLNPTVHIGGNCLNYNSNLKIGKTTYFITEACEYNSSFLRLTPETTIVLNVEHDHPDCFKTQKDVFDAFTKLVRKTKKCVIVPEKLSNILAPIKPKIKKYLTVGVGSSTYSIGKISFNCGLPTFDILKNQKYLLTASLNVYGTHNIYNALYAAACADNYKIQPATISLGLFNFKGIKRRFEVLDLNKTRLIISDYAHHPTEIEATIKTAKQVANCPILAIFEPHTYSRTKALLHDFVNSLSLADSVVILPTFSAREKPIKRASGKMLCSLLQKNNISATYKKTVKTLAKEIDYFIKQHEFSLVLFMGAGSVDDLARSCTKLYNT